MLLCPSCTYTRVPSRMHFIPSFIVVILVLSYSDLSRASDEGIQARRVCPGQRLPLSVNATMNEPFRSVVRITLKNKGRCSGILIGPRHVLTSAHCVHNRTVFTSPPASLKVGIVQKSYTLRIIATYFVRKVSVASLYVSGLRNSAKHDYAVLTLQRPHGRSYLKMEAMSNRDLKALRTVHFASFPKNIPPRQMWYTSCPYLKPKADLIMSRCVAMSGSSGAGVYALKSINERVVIGVLSGVKNSKCTTVTTRLTSAKIKEICTWMGRKDNCP